jgi:hypothetical protein
MITVYPVDAVSSAPLYSGRMAREVLSVFSAGATSADPLGCRSGVRPGTPSTTVTATSTTWTIGAHAGVLDLETAIEASGYLYAINVTSGLPTGAVTAANATNPRVDIVWLRVDDPAESDGSSVPAVVAGYTAGTAAPSPVPPATPARCMVLAWINVPVSGGGAPTVTWKAPVAVSAGGIIPTPDSTGYPATPYVGQYVDDATLGLLRWNGSAWTHVARQHGEWTSSSIAVPSGTLWGPGSTYAIDGTVSSTPALGTGTTDGITVTPAGIYAVNMTATFSVALGGRSFIGIKYAGNDIARVSIAAGESFANVTLPNLPMTTVSAVTFNVYQSLGSSVNMTTRVRLTKISD